MTDPVNPYMARAYIKLTGYSPQNKANTFPVHLLANQILGVVKNAINQNSVGSIVHIGAAEVMVLEEPDAVLKLITESLQ